MGLFGKKVDRDELIKQGIADAEASAAAPEQKADEVSTGNEKVDIELTKIKAQLESFGEIRKANQERFSRISEQTGELRGMILDANKAMGKVEVAATKAVDLVESVHPEKLMIDLRKQDGKIDAVRAMIESQDSIIKDLMAELKQMRNQMNFYKGTEQVLKMNEEVKRELAEIKKQEAVVERHADRVETIFLEVGKKFTNFEKYDDTVKEIKEGFRKMETDFEKMKASMIQKEDKKEFVDLLDKFNSFEKHTTNLLTLLDDRSKVTGKEMEAQFATLRSELIEEVKKGAIDEEGKAAAAKEQAAKAAEEAETARLKEEEDKKAAQEAEKNPVAQAEINPQTQTESTAQPPTQEDKETAQKIANNSSENESPEEVLKEISESESPQVEVSAQEDGPADPQEPPAEQKQEQSEEKPAESSSQKEDFTADPDSGKDMHASSTPQKDGKPLGRFLGRFKK